VYAPWFDGGIRANGTTIRQYADQRVTAAGIRTFGTVPADGRFTMALGTPRPQTIPRQAVGCLDPAALRHAVAGLRASGPAGVTAGGHSIAATFGRATTGTAVVAVPAVDGWRCSVDGAAARTPRTLGGLIAVGLGAGATRVACSYRTPGLGSGLLAAGAGLLVLLGVAAAGLRRRPVRTRPA